MLGDGGSRDEKTREREGGREMKERKKKEVEGERKKEIGRKRKEREKNGER